MATAKKSTKKVTKKPAKLAPKKTVQEVIEPPKKTKKAWPGVVLIIFALLALCSMLWLGYQLMDANNQLKKYKDDPAKVTEDETSNLTVKVGKILVLPANETPTIATVNDASKLSDKPFFVSAQNGDKVLIYAQAKRAVIYRPSTNQVVEVSSYSSGEAPVAQPQ